MCRAQVRFHAIKRAHLVMEEYGAIKTSSVPRRVLSYTLLMDHQEVRRDLLNLMVGAFNFFGFGVFVLSQC